jgi:predicted alpha/beta-hydrolase family hydrolase
MADRLQLPVGTHTVSALLSAAPEATALAVIAHGAGAGMEHPFMVGVSEGLAANGVSVLRFNFVYVEEGRRSPDRSALLTEAWSAALDAGIARAGELPVVAGGKSMGGRIASMLAAERGTEFSARALVFFGYPLHAPGRSHQPRDAHLPDVTVPMLFIQGTDDALATYALMQDLVRRLGRLARLHTVEGGDHSFRVRGARRPDDDTGCALGAVAAAFIHEVA